VITARALGVYVYLKASGAHISADSLSRTFPEGRKVFLSALKELRDAGLIETKRAVIKGKYVTYSQLTDGSPEKELLSQQSQLNSYKSLIAYSLISKPNSEPSSREEQMEYYESEDERLEAQAKWRASKHKDKMEAHESRRKERMERRSHSNAVGWSVTDSTFEFAEQMHSLWHIQPWQVTRSRFRFALADKRKEYNTDGALELKMMVLFFDQIKHDTKLSDPEMVWKKFIVNFGMLLGSVNNNTVTPEQLVEEQEQAKRTQGWLDNV
jgi:hypothetical protein